jgi:hypothetical protein
MLSMKQAARRPRPPLPSAASDDAQIAHRVVHHAADEELEGEIIDALPVVGVDRVGRLDPALDHDVPRREGDGEEPVALAGGDGVLADRIGQLGEHGRLQLLGGVLARGGGGFAGALDALLVHVARLRCAAVRRF